MLKVLEIFHSIDGEGIRAGELTTFIRLAGCNLHCKYCDTAYSINPKQGSWREMGVVEVASEARFGNVTITGGEPLLQPETAVLANYLASTGHSVNIETNGSMKLFRPCEGVFFTVDYKCGASGHEDAMNPEAFKLLSGKDVIKCVVGSEQDMESAMSKLLEWVPELGKPGSDTPWVYFSPVFGKIEPALIVDFMKRNDLQGRFRVQLQLHKFIWDPNAREV